MVFGSIITTTDQKKKKEKFYWSYRHIVTEHTANQSAVEKEKKK